MGIDIWKDGVVGNGSDKRRLGLSTDKKKIRAQKEQFKNVKTQKRGNADTSI